jgi:hypothetical protein
MAGRDRLPVTTLTGFLGAQPKLTTPVTLSRLTGRVTRVVWGADGSAQLLRWAATDEHGRVLIGRL